MFSIVDELKTVRQEKERLAGREAELSRPLLADLSLLPVLYQWFNEINAEGDFAPRTGSKAQRNKFTIIALRLYSPLTLIGEKMTPGLRHELSRLFGLHAPSGISNMCSNLVFYYHQYQSFRDETTTMYNRLLTRLEEAQQMYRKIS